MEMDQNNGMVEQGEGQGKRLPKQPSREFLRALKHAVDVGAVSTLSLQRNFKIDHQTACAMMEWMVAQGSVKDEGGKDALKTTLMSEESFEKYIQETGRSLKTKEERRTTVDDGLYKACLRLAIRRQKVDEKMLSDAFAICKVRANAVIQKMSHDGFIKFDCGVWSVRITQEQFETLYPENA